MKLFFGALLLVINLIHASFAGVSFGFNCIDRGYYDSTGFHEPTNRNYIVGDAAPSDGKIYRNWFVFNIPAGLGAISNAELIVRTGEIATPSATETFQLREVTTSVSTLTNGGSGLVVVYNDLGDGLIYGSTTISPSSSNSAIQFALNTNFKTAISNFTGGLLAIGGEISTLDGSDNAEYVFGNTHSVDSSLLTLILTLRDSPTIISQPVSKIVALNGTTNFAVGAVGQLPLAQQWCYNGSPISGATNSSLTLSNVSFANQGNYSVVITNSFGSVTSSVAYLSLDTTFNNGLMSFISVGNAGNSNDVTTGYGAVGYQYSIGKYEVTLLQYAAFLNAVAATDTYTLYNPTMATDLNIAGISRSGASGSYTYAVIGDGNRPVSYVNWFDAARFANWQHNGRPTGAQTAATTEDGAYTLNGATSGTNFNKNITARYWIPSENEWYKAAYHQPASQGGDSDDFWLYPTASNTEPNSRNGSSTDVNSGNFVRDDSIANGFNGGYAVSQSPNYSGSQQFLTAAGAFSVADSFYGTFDQCGNVWEWNDAMIGATRGLRGGAWDGGTFVIQASFQYGSVPTFEGSGIGFRIAATAAPLIAQQPQSQTAVYSSNATFTVSVTGVGPFAYQWLFNSAPLSGATNASLVVSNVSFANQGNYSVVITNNFGSVTSSVATLTVFPAQPALWLKADVGVTLDGSGRVSQWLDQSGTAHHASQGTASARPQFVAGALGGQPILRFGSGGNHSFALAGQVLASQQFTIVAVANSTATDPTHREIISNWEFANMGTSLFLGITQQNPVRARLSDSFAFIGAVTNPAAHFVFTGVSGTNNAFICQDRRLLGARGSALPARILTTPWYIGTQGNLTAEYWNGDIGEILVFSKELTAEELDQVWNYLQSKYLISATAAPQIALQPQNQTVVYSSNATFTVSAVGSGPLAYQWLSGDSPVSDATNSSLTLSDVSLANQGNYSVVITNSFGSVTSSVVTLTVQSLTVASMDVLATPGNGQLQTPASVLLTNDVAGSVNGSNTNLVIHSVSATSSNGGTVSLVYTQAWVGRYDGAAHLHDQVSAAVSDSSGNVIVAGISNPTNGLSDWLVAKYAPDGTQLWTDTHNGPANTADAATAVTVDGAGNIYVIGHSYQAGTSQDYFTRKYAPNGTLVWEQRRDGGIGSDDFPRAVAIDSGTNVYVAGYSTGSGTGYDIYTVKYSPAGVFQWADRFHGALGDDLGNAIAIDASNNVFVAGNSRNINNDDDMVVLKLNPSGTRLWSRTLNRGRGRAVAVDASGNVMVTGTQTPVGTPDNFAIVKWDGSGTALWTNLFDGPVAGNDDGRAIAVGNDGSIYAGGLATTATGLDFILFRLNSNGTGVWTNFYDAYGYSDVMTALKLDAFGRIYASGYSVTPPGTKTEITTLAYWPDGQMFATNRFNPNSAADHVATAVVSDSNGGWAVAGHANFGISAGDATTVKIAPWIFYTPPTNFFGTDTFTYVVQDVAGLMATGTVTVAAASLPVIIAQTGNVSIECGSVSATNLSVTATGSSPLNYRWYLNGVFHADTGTSNSLTGVNEIWSGFPMNPAPYTCVVSNSYGSATSSVMQVSRVDTTPPVVTSWYTTNVFYQPCNSPLFDYSAFGNLVATDCSAIFRAQPFPSPGTSVGPPGTTNFVVLNVYDSYFNSTPINIQVISFEPPPSIQPWPQGNPNSVATNLGAYVYFCANFQTPCGGSFVVQWHKDGVPISGATNSCLDIPSLSLADAGVYQAFATNQLHYGQGGGYGSSATATLTIVVPPSVDPLTTRLVYGSDGFSLNANGSGTGPLSYQWRLDGTNLLGATGAAFVGTGSPGSAGNYDVVICNPYGCVTSSVVAASFFGDLKFYAGTILAGGVGTNYRVDYADVIGGVTNSWQTLTTVTLPYSPYLVIDPYSPTQTMRFYRAVPLP